MGDLTISFGRGAALPLRLFEAEAVRNAAALSDALPVTGMARHCSWSGEGIFWTVEGLSVNQENLRRVAISPGTLCIEHYPAGVRVPGPWTALLLVYGERFWFKNPFTPTCTLALLGRVEAGPAELRAIGERIHKSGIEAVTVHR